MKTKEELEKDYKFIEALNIIKDHAWQIYYCIEQSEYIDMEDFAKTVLYAINELYYGEFFDPYEYLENGTPSDEEVEELKHNMKIGLAKYELFTALLREVVINEWEFDEELDKHLKKLAFGEEDEE